MSDPTSPPPATDAPAAPAPAAEPPTSAPASDPAPAPASDPAPASGPASNQQPPSPDAPAAKPQESPAKPAQKAPGGIPGVINKAKGHAGNAAQWIKAHPVGAGAIGAGVAIGSILVGWVIFRALKGRGRKDKDRDTGRKRHARSIDGMDEVKMSFPRNAIERRAVVDEIDWDDEEFLEFLELFPGVDDLIAFEE